MFRAMAADFSVLLFSCSITTGALGSPGLLSLYSIITISFHTTIILTIAFLFSSHLIYRYVRILTAVRRSRPDVVFVLENVYGMPSKDRDIITASLGVTPVRLRACDVSACRRDRYFWSNLPARGLKLPTSTPHSSYSSSHIIPSFAEFLSSGQPLVADDKAGCIVRAMHSDWNLVRETDSEGGVTTRSLYPEEEERLMGFPEGYTNIEVEIMEVEENDDDDNDNDDDDDDKEEEEDKQQTQTGKGSGFSSTVGEKKTIIGSKRLSSRQRHMLIGNSFSVFVVEQLLRPLKALGDCVEEEGAKTAMIELGLRDRLNDRGDKLATDAAKKWCSHCDSAAHCFTH